MAGAFEQSSALRIAADGFELTHELVVLFAQGSYDQTVGKAVALKLEAETLGADGTWRAGEGDLAYVRVTAVDEQGRRVYCTPDVRVAVEGAATLMGYGSGDPVTKHNYWEDNCALFDGVAVAVLRSAKKAGKVRVSVQAEGLAGAQIEIETK